MLKHKKLIIILLSIAFFLTALTLYANKVLFPTLIKKIAVEQATKFLHRNVTIDDIRFNWVKGLIVDKVVIYQQEAPDQIFAQFDHLSMGLIFIPGFKEHTLNIPYINITNPSIHVIRHDATRWNFSDLLTPPPAKPDEKPSNIKISLGGVNIIDGKIRLEDETRKPLFSEIFDNINLKMSLSYKGITFDFTTNIPAKKGSLAARGHYMPINNSVDANIRLKNIDTASYLNLVDLKGFTLTSGIISDVNIDVEYSKDRIALKGDMELNKFDVTSGVYHASTSLNAKNLDIIYVNGATKAHGDISTSALEFTMPDTIVKAANGINIHLNQGEFDKDRLVFDGNVKVKPLAINLKDQSFNGEFALEGIKLRRDNTGAQIVGSIITNNLNIAIDKQKVTTTSLIVKSLIADIDTVGGVNATADIKATKFNFNQPQQHLSADLDFSDFKITTTPKGLVAITTKAIINDYDIVLEKQLTTRGSLNASKLMLKLFDGTLKVGTDFEITKGSVELPDNKTIKVSPQIELTADVPLKNPAEATYEGSITFSDATVSGFPYTPLDGIGLDADFKTDTATINAFTVNLLETSLRASGTVNNFKKPSININAEANDINLSLLKNYIPEVFSTNGLTTDGLASLKIKFDGNLQDPLAGEIKALITLDKVNVASTKFNQNVKNISGIVEATPNSLVWRDFKGTYLNQSYTLTGKLDDFKNPKVTTTLDGADVQLKADIVKNGNTVTINELIGKYLKISFDVAGSVDLPEGKQPLLNITAKSKLSLSDIIALLPEAQRKNLVSLNLSGDLNVDAAIKGPASTWQQWESTATITSPLLSVMNYKINNLKFNAQQKDGKVNNAVIDASIYDGTAHIVSSIDLNDPKMPFETALNLDAVDLKKLKMDSPLSTEEINGKFYLTSVATGDASDIMNLKAKGSLGIHDGFLGEFKIFKGLFGILNEALKLGQVMVTDVDGNFIIENQRFTTDSMRLHSPTIVMLANGWIGFDQMCDLKVTVDLSSGIVPSIAEDVLRSIEVHIYDKVSNPKFTKKISMPQVINTLIKTIGIFQ